MARDDTRDTPARRAKRSAPPLLRTVVREAPLYVLVLLLTALWWRHFKVSFGPLATFVGAVSPLLWSIYGREGRAKRTITAGFNLLRRRTMVIALWIAVAVLGIGSLSFASARVTAEEPVAGWLYRMETPRAGGAAVKVDSVQLDAGSPHFAMIAAPWARHVWFVTSDYRRTPAQNLAGWSAPVLRYPSQFEAVNTVALLPLPQLALYTRGGRTMRVVVHDEAGQLVAVDSLRDLNSIPSLLLSEVRAPDPDSVTLTRWRQRFLTIAKDSADSSSIMKFRGWREARWMQAQHPLVPNQKLLVRLITATGDTVARETVTINKAYTDALLSRRS